MEKQSWKNTKELLNFLNTKYHQLHTKYENLFWISAMGDTSVDGKKDTARETFENFRINNALFVDVQTFLNKEKNTSLKQRLLYWQEFFSTYQAPNKAVVIKNKITILESKIQKRRGKRKEGYIDPKTKKFVVASRNAMSSIISTNADEQVRKACFDAVQGLAIGNITEYIQLIGLRNQYAHMLGYKDFYEYKLALEEKMTKKELFEDLWKVIYDKTEYAFKDIRALEKTKLGLRKPWNFGYMMVGDFTKEEDPYFPFEQSIDRWARSFAALGIDYKGGSMVFDLIDRKGKYNNGFCHWPELVCFEQGRRIPAKAQLTCNVVLGIPGESFDGLHTLFHECGHAAHLLNAQMLDVCVNSEYPPLSTAWAETQSMFLDRIFSSVEWRIRYAKNNKGEVYPFDLYERETRALHILSPLYMMGIIMVCAFEKDIYEAKNLTSEKVVTLAKKHFKLHTDRSVDSLSILEVPHLYSWESACSYHGYGLAVLALSQWREYFFKKYGYIVDNPNIGKEMAKVWQYGGSKPFPEFVKLATGKKLSANAYLTTATMPLAKKLTIAKECIATLAKKPALTKEPNLNAVIQITSGKKLIVDNKKGINAMAKKYTVWLKTQQKAK